MPDPTTNLTVQNRFNAVLCPGQLDKLCYKIGDSYVPVSSDENNENVNDTFIWGSNLPDWDSLLAGNEAGNESLVMRKENFPNSDFFAYYNESNLPGSQHSERGLGFLVDNEDDVQWGIGAGVDTFYDSHMNDFGNYPMVNLFFFIKD